MATVQLKLSPLDHGKRLSLTEFEDADYEPGYRYEIIDGRLYVSPAPNLPESILESWLRRKLERYMEARPDVIGYVATRGRVFLPARVRPSVPEPDLAVYGGFPHDTPISQLRWQDLSPIVVAEVLVGGDMAKDLTRNPDLYLRVPTIREYWVLNGSQSPDEPVLVCHRRRGKSWAVTTFPYGSTFSTKLLPGFELVIDPRK